MTNIDSALKGRHITLQTKVHVVKAMVFLGFPDCSASKESACNAGDPNSIPGSGRSAGEWIGCPLQYSGLENSIDCIVLGVAKSQTGLSDFHFTLLHSPSSSHVQM